jgi:hypothetical protein
MSSYQSKSAVVLARQLEAQKVCAIIDISTASAVVSDCAAVTASGAIITKAVVLDCGEPVAKCLSVRAIDRASGAVVAANSAPVVSGNTITVSLIGTAHSDCAVEFTYIVA